MHTLPLIKYQESRGNPKPKDGTHGEVGVYQIRQCVVDDVNQKYGTQYTLADCRDEEKAETIAINYLYMWGEKKGAKTIEELCRIFNGGPNGNKVKATVTYWKDIAQRNGLKV